MPRYVFLLTCGLLGCSSLPASRPPISFTSVESIAYGIASSGDAMEAFGKPDRRITLADGSEIWSYAEADSSGDRVSRLTLDIEKGTGRLTGSTWVPRGNEPLKSKDGIFAHFKDANFKKTVVGWDSERHHHYSWDETYSDERRGISFYLNTYHDSVEDIAFGPSAPARGLGNE